MTKEDQAIVDQFIAQRGITKCPPVLAPGAEAKQALKKHVAAERRQWWRDHGSMKPVRTEA